MAPQVLDLFRRQLKHKVLGEAVDIAFDRAHQRLRLDLVKHGQVTIENHLLVADQQDGAFDPIRGNQASVGYGHGMPIGLPLGVTGFRLACPRWLARNIAGDPGGDKRGCPTSITVLPGDALTRRGRSGYGAGTTGVRTENGAGVRRTKDRPPSPRPLSQRARGEIVALTPGPSPKRQGEKSSPHELEVPDWHLNAACLVGGSTGGR